MNNNFLPLINKLKKIGDEITGYETNILSNDKKDIKLAVDLENNQKLTSFLMNKYSYNILSEESEDAVSYTKFKEPFWIIDPLDGSLNFSRNIPTSCISVVLWNDNSPDFGCIYDFNRKEVFWIENEKCVMNGSECYTSSTSKIENSVLCTGFPSWRNYNDDSLKTFLQKIQHWKKIRAIGSAALSLSWVARGWADAYIEEDIRIWDVAAGLALVKAAGGEIHVKENDQPNFVTAIATNGKIPVSELQ